MRRRDSLLVVALLAASLISCSRKEEIVVRNARDDEIGKEVVCPVTEDRFKVSAETKAVDYRGTTYYLCCPDCEAQFTKSPLKYTGQASIRPEGIEKEGSGDKEILYWTCSMHPQVRQDKPGKCPICGMELIPVYKKEGEESGLEEKRETLLGIKSQPAGEMYLTKTLRLPAKVAYDNVLYLAQQEYLSSFHDLMNVEEIDGEPERRLEEALQATRLRLALLGYDEKEIGKLRKSTGPDKNLIYPGAKVWMHADVYEYDFSLVRPGQKVVASTPAYPGEEFSGVVRFVEPVLHPETRAAKARIEFDNPRGKLKLEMYANVGARVSLGKHVAIQDRAVIDTGVRKIVYLDLGEGRYEMRQVRTGFEADGYVQILDGVKPGDMVVVEGNFLLDSQATLTGGQSLLYEAAEEVKEERKEVEHRH